MTVSIKTLVGLGVTGLAGYVGYRQYDEWRSEPTDLAGLEAKLETYPKHNEYLKDTPGARYLNTLKNTDCSILRNYVLPSFQLRQCEARKTAFAHAILKDLQQQHRDTSLVGDASTRIAQRCYNHFATDQYHQCQVDRSLELVRAALRSPEMVKPMKKSWEATIAFQDYKKEIGEINGDEISAFLHVLDGSPEQLVSRFDELDEQARVQMIKDLTEKKEELKKTGYRPRVVYD